MSPGNEIFVGRIVKAFGIDGELKFAGSDNFWPEVLNSERLVMRTERNGVVEETPARLERVRPHGLHFVLKLDGVDGRDDAEAAVGTEFFIDVDAIDVALPERELPFQVVGQTVRLEDGSVLGRVTGVIFSSAHPVYEVTGEDGVVLIPGVDEFVVARDEERKEMTIRPIPGLIDG